jgi:hypothetical protein
VSLHLPADEGRLRAKLEEFAQQCTAQGQLIEAGWIGLRLAAIPLDAPQIQIDEMRSAFFAGAQHLMSSIAMILDPGEEPTDADLVRMQQIDAELTRFITEYAKRHGMPGPNLRRRPV